MNPLKGLGLRSLPLMNHALALTRPSSAMFRGTRLYLDRYDAVITPAVARNDYEIADLEIADRYATNRTMVDVGANIGVYSATVAAAKVYAFEPSPRAFKLLQKNTNHLRHVNVFNTAVSDYHGTANLWLNDYNHGDNRLHGDTGVTVPVTTLDSVIGEPIDFMKIDTQGSEVAVLRGARGLIERSPDLVMLIEYWPHGLEMAGSSSADLLGLLDDLGFEYDHVGTPMQDCTEENHVGTNILCIRKRAS